MIGTKGSLPLLSRASMSVQSARPSYDPYASAVTVYDLPAMVSEWMGIEYAELSVVLVHLKHLQLIHQVHHWVSCGDPFYSDHLMFQRLYDAVNEHIDSVAEKAVGLGSERNVEPVLIAKQLSRLMASNCSPMAGIPSSTDLVKRSLKAEHEFVDLVKRASLQLSAHGALSYGLDNLLAQLADDHEKSVYLLKQRCGGNY